MKGVGVLRCVEFREKLRSRSFS